jgi:NADP-reducing hydrogenase subunit HndB
MAKTKTSFYCQNCGAQHSKWQGQCSSCKEWNTLVEEVNKRDLQDIEVTQTGCIGVCRLEPIFEVYQNGEKVTYVNMDSKKAKEVIVNHIVNGNVVSKYTIGASEE